MYDYRLTHQNALAMFFNSIFLGDKLGYESIVLDRMITDVNLDVSDVREQLKETRPEIPVPGYVSPDGKIIVLDERYISQHLQRFDLSRFGVNEEYLLPALVNVIQQSAMDHEALGHSYYILNGDIDKLRKKIGKELSSMEIKPSDIEKEAEMMLLKRIEMIASKVQIECANYRTKLCEDKLKKAIWEAWAITLKKEYKQKVRYD